MIFQEWLSRCRAFEQLILFHHLSASRHRSSRQEGLSHVGDRLMLQDVLRWKKFDFCYKKFQLWICIAPSFGKRSQPGRLKILKHLVQASAPFQTPLLDRLVIPSGSSRSVWYSSLSRWTITWWIRFWFGFIFGPTGTSGEGSVTSILTSAGEVVEPLTSDEKLKVFEHFSLILILVT